MSHLHYTIEPAVFDRFPEGQEQKDSPTVLP